MITVVVISVRLWAELDISVDIRFVAMVATVF